MHTLGDLNIDTRIDARIYSEYNLKYQPENMNNAFLAGLEAHSNELINNFCSINKMDENLSKPLPKRPAAS